MWKLVAETGAGYVAMHMQGTPQTMQVKPRYNDVVREVGEFFAERLERLQAAGVKAEQVALDVGIGFGKTVEHNLQLLAGLESFKRLGRPLLIGVSRKSFLGTLAGSTAVEDRSWPTVAMTSFGCSRGAGPGVRRGHQEQSRRPRHIKVSHAEACPASSGWPGRGWLSSLDP